MENHHFAMAFPWFKPRGPSPHGRQGPASASNDVKKAAQRKYVQSGKFQAADSADGINVAPVAVALGGHD